jgi:NDP-sugar pyrophosphorylase family protein
LHEENLLETGGGLKNAEPWIGTDPFIVYSGDILTDIDLESLIDEHFRRQNDVTLALRNTGLATGLTLHPDGRLIAIAGAGGDPDSYDFANVSVWNSDIFRRIPRREKSPSFRSFQIGYETVARSEGGAQRTRSGSTSDRAKKTSPRSIARSASGAGGPAI